MHQPGRRPRGWIAVAVAVVVAIGVGVPLSWRLTDHRTAPAPVAAGRPSASASTGTVQAPPSTLASPAGSAASPAPGNASVPASGGSVPVSPSATQQANAEQVAAFLGTYFVAINERDYLAYVSLFEESARPVRNAQQFLSGFSTTADSGPVLVALAPTSAGGWAATVTFVSHQSPAASQTRSSCTSWNLTLYLEPDGNSYLIGLPPAGYQPSHVAC